jgi:hypothetical protein
MATAEEIDRRIEEVDLLRSSRRTVAAKRISELATQRAAVAERLSDLERELGDVLAESSDVLEIDELARFTDIPAVDLIRWLNDRTATRPKRKRPAPNTSAGGDGPSRRASPVSSTSASSPATRHEPAVPPSDEP